MYRLLLIISTSEAAGRCNFESELNVYNIIIANAMLKDNLALCVHNLLPSFDHIHTCNDRCSKCPPT